MPRVKMSMFSSSMHMPSKKKMILRARMHLPNMKLPMSNEKMLMYSTEVLVSKSRMCYFLVCVNHRLCLLQVTLVFNFYFMDYANVFSENYSQMSIVPYVSQSVICAKPSKCFTFYKFLQIGPNLLRFPPVKILKIDLKFLFFNSKIVNRRVITGGTLHFQLHVCIMLELIPNIHFLKYSPLSTFPLRDDNLR